MTQAGAASACTNESQNVMADNDFRKCNLPGSSLITGLDILMSASVISITSGMFCQAIQFHHGIVQCFQDCPGCGHDYQ